MYSSADPVHGVQTRSPAWNVATADCRRRHRALPCSASMTGCVQRQSDPCVAGAASEPRIIVLAASPACWQARSQWRWRVRLVRSQREMYEYQTVWSATSWGPYPKEEAKELALIYEARACLGRGQAAGGFHDRRSDRGLDTLARRGVGTEPAGAGLPGGTARPHSVVRGGALIPLLSFLFGKPERAFTRSD